jgi:hypothetical protein
MNSSVVCLKEFTKFIYLNKENQQEAKCGSKLTNRLMQIKITLIPSNENPHHQLKIAMADFQDGTTRT